MSDVLSIAGIVITVIFGVMAGGRIWKQRQSQSIKGGEGYQAGRDIRINQRDE